MYLFLQNVRNNKADKSEIIYIKGVTGCEVKVIELL